MSNETTARNGRDWIKIAALALMPTLAAGLLALGMAGDSGEAEAGTVPSSTTTTLVVAERVEYDPADYAVEEIPHTQPAASEEPEIEEDAEAETPVPSDDGKDDPPAAALMSLPETVGVVDGQANIEVSNLGELTLEIFEVDVNGHPLEVNKFEDQVAGYSSETIRLNVDTANLPFGDYTLTVSISTSDGVGHVDVVGTKGLIFIPLLPDVDVPDAYVLPHGANQLKVKLVNNEAYVVTVDLSSADDRLVFPDQVDLAPGANQIDIIVQALPVQPQVIDLLELDVSWAGSELGTIEITKHGS
jgi:hypothetical protein